MKYVYSAIVIPMLLCLSASAQGIDITFTPEGVQTVTENTELVLSDPTVSQTTLYLPQTQEDQKKESSGSETASDLGGFSIGVESEISGANKSFSLPLRYAWKHVSVGATVPYIFQRKMNYTLNSVEASGIGDVSANIGFNGGRENFSFSANAFAKFATGDDEEMVDGYLIPLGTGSLDLVFHLSAMKTFNRFSLSGSGSYRLNGSSEKIAEVTYADDQDGDLTTTDIETVNYTITNGNMFSFMGRFDYSLTPKWTVGAAATMTIVEEGETDADHSFSWSEPDYSTTGQSNHQDMTLVDIVPMVSYYLFVADLTVMAKIPVMTERNEFNNEGDRDMTFLLKLSRKL